ncbi:hypothetical protein [Rhodococcus zopfii]|uniref:hypothetical protein n=1 Tax=Rhodococcus zopfii TaxID=43772 RepID=UPI0035273C01
MTVDLERQPAASTTTPHGLDEDGFGKCSPGSPPPTIATVTAGNHASFGGADR